MPARGGFRLVEWNGPKVQRQVEVAAAASLNEIAGDIALTARKRAASETGDGEYVRSISKGRSAKPSDLSATVIASSRSAKPIEARKRILFGARRAKLSYIGLSKLIRSKLK